MESLSAGDAIPVAFCFDAGFAPYAAAAIASLLANSDAYYRVYCLFSGADEEFPAEIRRMSSRYRCELVQVTVPRESFADWRIDAGMHFTPAAYYRLLIPDLVPEDRVIYLDCDLTVTCGLSGLFAHDLAGAWVGGCIDAKGQHTTQMRLVEGDPYLNSGVLLMDLVQLRQHRPLSTIKEFYQTYEASVTWVDQCLINKFTEGRKSLIPAKWNVQFNDIESADVDRTLAEKEGDAILHFSGPTKPWMEWSPSSLTTLWSKYARLAGFAPGAAIKRAQTIADLTSLASKHEAEGEWERATATWKSIAYSLEAHLRSAMERAARAA